MRIARAPNLVYVVPMFRWITIAILATVACASTHAKRMPDGSYAIECNAQKVCLDRAERECGPTGYVIVSGEHGLKVVGVDGNEKVVGKDELRIRCKGPPSTDSVDSSASRQEVGQTDGGILSQPVPAKTPMCRAGETQKCFGPGACVGGQACAANGARFGPCNCGPSK